MQSDKTRIHPAAEIFPLMSGEAFEALKADIAANGQQESILYYEGQLLDGRNRLRACLELGIPPEESEIDTETIKDPVAWVLSANLHRRHLETGQRSMIAARMAKLKRGSNLKRGDKMPEGSNDPSVSDAAAMLSVSDKSVKRAKHVIEHGSKELVQAVEQKRYTLRHAGRYA